VQEFHKELVERRKSVAKVVRNTSLSTAALDGGSCGGSSELVDTGDETTMTSEDRKKTATLQQKWTMLWRLSLDVKKKLQDNFAGLLQVSRSGCVSPAVPRR